MDKRKIWIIVIGVVGIVVIAIGIKAAMVYSTPIFMQFPMDIEHYRSFIIEARNAEFNEWIVDWIVRPLGLFLILTAAIVVSRVIRVILKKIK